MRINKFKPPQYSKDSFDQKDLSDLLGKNIQYASKGRWAFHHILKAEKIRGDVAIPAYICDKVLSSFSDTNAKPVFFDVDPRDLNPSFEDFVKLAESRRIEAVLVASLYGFPAELDRFEKYCMENSILMIDDAAQSFGAKLNGRYVGSFGGSGFLSFSPGKSTAGPMGSFFWTGKEYSFARSENTLFHLVSYLDFYINRLKVDTFKRMKMGALIPIAQKFVFDKFLKTDIRNDEIPNFERKILEAIVFDILNGKFDFRKKYFTLLTSSLDRHACLEPVRSLRGEDYPHKLVVRCKNADVAVALRSYLMKADIYSGFGYPLLMPEHIDFEGLSTVSGRIVEIPIENDEKKMEYLQSTLNQFS